MINIRAEGEPIKFGLNLWPKNDDASKGFILRFAIPFHYVTWRVRYSKVTKITHNTFEIDNAASVKHLNKIFELYEKGKIEHNSFMAIIE